LKLVASPPVVLSIDRAWFLYVSFLFYSCLLILFYQSLPNGSHRNSLPVARPVVVDFSLFLSMFLLFPEAQ